MGYEMVNFLDCPEKKLWFVIKQKTNFKKIMLQKQNIYINNNYYKWLL